MQKAVMFMELNIRHRLRNIYISDSDKNDLFVIESKRFLTNNKTICDINGKAVYSIRLDPNPLDNRVKYIFTEHETKNEFYAWVDMSLYSNRTFLSRIFLPPLEFYIEAESFFGEIEIKRKELRKFYILINGKVKGFITKNKISCEDIDDKGLLAMLYVFSVYLSDNEEQFKVADMI